MDAIGRTGLSRSLRHCSYSNTAIAAVHALADIPHEKLTTY